MATTKKRIHVSLGPEAEQVIARLAERDSVPQATKASQLLELALELEEGMAWDRLAEERYSKRGERLSHTEVWQ